MIVFPNNKEFLANYILQRTDIFIKSGGGRVLNSWLNGSNKIGLANYLINQKKVKTFLDHTVYAIKKEVDELISSFDLKKIDNIVSIGPGNGILELLLLRKIEFEINLRLYQVLEDTSYLETAYNQVQEKSSAMAEELSKKFLRYRIYISKILLFCNIS